LSIANKLLCKNAGAEKDFCQSCFFWLLQHAMLFCTQIENKELPSLLLLPLRFAGEKALLLYCQKEEKTEAEKRQKQVGKEGSH